MRMLRGKGLGISIEIEISGEQDAWMQRIVT